MGTLGNLMIFLGLDHTQLSSGLNKVSSDLKNTEKDLEATGNAATKAGDKLGKDVPNGAKAASTATKQYGEDSKQAGEKVAESSKKATSAWRDVTVGVSSVATAGFLLYQTFDDIEKKQYALEKSALALTKSEASLAEAQKEYNEVLADTGPDLKKIEEAQKDLNKSQEDSIKAQEDLVDAGESLAKAQESVARAITDAQDELADAHNRVEDAEQSLMDTEASLMESRLGIEVSTQGIIIAQNKLAEAIQVANNREKEAAVAQSRYNDAVKTFGETSDEAESAHRSMTNAMEASTRANNDVTEAQFRVTNSTTELEIANAKLAAKEADLVLSKENVKDKTDEYNEALNGQNDASRKIIDAQTTMKEKEEDLVKAQKESLKAAEKLTTAQDLYNASLLPAGPDVEKLKEATDKLSMAQETLRLAQERNEILQGNLNEQWTRAGLVLLPSMITGIDGTFKVFNTLKNLDVGAVWKKIGDGMQNVISTHGRLTTALGMTGGAMMILMAFTTKNEQMRQVFSIIAGGLIAVAAAQWVWNTAQAFGAGLTVVGISLLAIAAAAAAGTYLLASQFGATIENDSNYQNYANGTGSQYVAGGSNGSQPTWQGSDSATPTSSTKYGIFFANGQEYIKNARGETVPLPSNVSESDWISMTDKGYLYDPSHQGWYPVPKLAEGGIVPATPGGMLVRVGEGGYAERITPLNGKNNGGATIGTITINVPGAGDPELVARRIVRQLQLETGVKF